MEHELWEGSLEESDRGFVIVAHSFLDQALKDLCQAQFEANGVAPKIISKLLNSKSDEGPPPIQGFWMKAILAHAFGLIEGHLFEALVELNTLRNTRGAHSPKRYSLTEPDARRIVGKLDPNLAEYITKIADSLHQEVLQIRGDDAVGNAAVWKNHTYARCLLETAVFVVHGRIQVKAIRLVNDDRTVRSTDP